MSSLSPTFELGQCAAELHRAVPELLERGLYSAAKWASELLTSTGIQPGRTAGYAPGELHDEPADMIAINLAKSFFGLRQYGRAVRALSAASSDLAVFLRSYSRFLDGEKRKEEQQMETSQQLQRAQVINAELAGLYSELSDLFDSSSLDGFGMFLFGIVLKHMDRLDRCRQVLVESVNAYPCNWSAWKLLASVCPDRNIVSSLSLADHWMKYFFLVDVHLELHDNNDAMSLLNILADDEHFPASTHLLAQTALVHYNQREFDVAQELFEELRQLEPDRIENMDSYSNILYVKEAKGALSYLAHNAVKTDKFRPETCCIIGNYYSLKSEHDKSVLYFQRALKLNPNYLSAWTLMGHEYVELRNTAAAIEAYRKAVDINSRDYRAWYGLGQTYELLQMHTYSLYYFGKATHLRPFDPRMWCAMAESYEKLDRVDDAIRCYRRAEGTNDREGIALFKLAKLYNSIKAVDKACEYYRKMVDRLWEGYQDDDDSSSHNESPDTIEALLFLTRYYIDRRQVGPAHQYCQRLLDIGGTSKQEAKALYKEVMQLADCRSPSRITQDVNMSISP